MKRCLLILLAVLLVGLLLGSDSPKEYNDEIKTDGLEGEWDKVDVLYGGQHLGRSGHPTLIIQRHQFTWQGGGETTPGNYTVDTKTKPAHTIQLPTRGPCKGTTWKMVHQVEGDRLTIAYLGVMTEYPKGFD